VLEVGLVVRTGRQHDDVRRAAVQRRAGEQHLPQLAEERRQGVYPQRVERVGQHARHDRAVLQRVADAGWRLRPRADHAPLSVGAAREIEGDQVQKDAVGGADAMTRAQKAGMPEDQRRRQQALPEQILRSVDVGGDSVEQPRTLTQAGADPIPFRRGDDQRQDVEAPGTLHSVGGCVVVVGDAVFVDLPRDALLCLRQHVGVQFG
jgi:hypothetical protein